MCKLGCFRRVRAQWSTQCQDCGARYDKNEGSVCTRRHDPTSYSVTTLPKPLSFYSNWSLLLTWYCIVRPTQLVLVVVYWRGDRLRWCIYEYPYCTSTSIRTRYLVRTTNARTYVQYVVVFLLKLTCTHGNNGLASQRLFFRAHRATSHGHPNVGRLAVHRHSSREPGAGHAVLLPVWFLSRSLAPGWPLWRSRCQPMF